MALLNNPRESPPDDFWYVEPSTGVRITGHFLGELIERVCAHREYKGIAPFDRASVDLIVQRQLCAAAPPAVCNAEPGEDYQPLADRARGFTKENVLSASASTLAWMKSGELVDRTESARRAAICRGCRLNRGSPSWVCSLLCSSLEALVPSGRREEGLQLCGICNCSLAAKVLAPEPVIAASNAGRSLVFPSYCWQGLDSTNPAKTPKGS